MIGVVAAQVCLLDEIDDTTGDDGPTYYAQRIGRQVLRRLSALGDTVGDCRLTPRLPAAAAALRRLTEEGAGG